MAKKKYFDFEPLAQLRATKQYQFRFRSFCGTLIQVRNKDSNLARIVAQKIISAAGSKIKL